MTSEELARKAADLALDKRAYDVKILDLKELYPVCDYFVICSADVDVQVKAIADHVRDSLSREDCKCWHREGYDGLRWVLLDYVDVVVHIFLKEIREFYALETLWGDAPTEEIAA
jgi:ribosome-associated protein